MDAAKLKAFAGMGAGEAKSGKGGMVGEPGMAKPPMKQKESDLAKKAREMMAKAVEVAEDVGDSKLATRRLRQAYTIAPNSLAVRAKIAEYGLALEPTTGLPPGQ